MLKIFFYKSANIIDPDTGTCVNSKHFKYCYKSVHIIYPNTGIYAKQLTFEILVYKTEHNQSFKGHVPDSKHFKHCLTLSHLGDLIHSQPGADSAPPPVILLSLIQIKPNLLW